MNFPAFPAADPKPQPAQNSGPPRKSLRGPWPFSRLLLGGAASCALVGVLFVGFGSKGCGTSEPERSARRDDRALSADEGDPAPGIETETVARPPEPRPEPPAQPAVAPLVTARSEPPAEWPPARAFTERCKAPGGGCLEQCTALAGGRCLDPCFIHTAECSKDCQMLDGSCGWPPPDSE